MVQQFKDHNKEYLKTLIDKEIEYIPSNKRKQLRITKHNSKTLNSLFFLLENMFGGGRGQIPSIKEFGGEN